MKTSDMYEILKTIRFLSLVHSYDTVLNHFLNNDSYTMVDYRMANELIKYIKTNEKYRYPIIGDFDENGDLI